MTKLILILLLFFTPTALEPAERFEVEWPTCIMEAAGYEYWMDEVGGRIVKIEREKA